MEPAAGSGKVPPDEACKLPGRERQPEHVCKLPGGERQPERTCKLPRGDRPPYALDVFSGENAPVAYALAWCGWRVEPIDWLLNAHHDLSKLGVQQSLAILVGSCDAAIWAVDCSTLSREREVAIPGHNNGPKLLRAENAVRGLQSLAGRDATRIEQSNLFIDFTFAQVARSVAAGKAAILEPPARSHLWGFQQLKDIRKMPEWRTLYDACCWGGARRKQQALESNVPEIQALRSSCHHVHSKSGWTPYRGADGAMVYPSSGEAEYTADLAFAMAVALGWWTVRNGRAKLRVPRAPVAQEAGNRVGWADVPPQIMRGWVMAATAVRLGLEPPTTRPGKWFPEEDTARITCWRKHVTAKNPAGSAVYVGQTEGCSRSSRTKWASPFVPGQHRTPAECFTKCVLWFRSQKELREFLREIAGKGLACECPFGQPCHADFLASQARMRPDKRSGHTMMQKKAREATAPARHGVIG